MTEQQNHPIEMPSIKDFLQLPAERDATHWQDARRFLQATISKDVLPVIQKWLTVQSELEKLIGEPPFNTLHDGWRSTVLANYKSNKDAIERHFWSHIEAGGAPLEWLPWEALEVPSFEIWVEELLTAQVAMAESRTYGERIGPILTGLLAHTIAHGEWDVLTQIVVSAVIRAGENASG